MSSLEEVNTSPTDSSREEHPNVTTLDEEPNQVPESQFSKGKELLGLGTFTGHEAASSLEREGQTKSEKPAGQVGTPVLVSTNSDEQESDLDLRNLKIYEMGETEKVECELRVDEPLQAQERAQFASSPSQDHIYLDSTPSTPNMTASPSRQPSFAVQGGALTPTADDRPTTGHDQQSVYQSADNEQAEVSIKAEDDSKSEIQSIMEQFDDRQYVPEEELPPSPVHLMQHPPRNSSLEPLGFKPPPISTAPPPGSSYMDDLSQLQDSPRPGSHKAPSIRSISFTQSRFNPTDNSNPLSPTLLSPSLNKSLPPAPDPEPDLPFDFHRFLEQLRHRTADPVAKFLRSFLLEFGKKQWMVHEQVKIISDFLSFITGKMASCEVWREVSDPEFDNAKEGMEKLVMNRLYSQTFSPVIPPPAPIAPVKGKRKPGQLGPGRRGQHQEDVERDEILTQKVKIYGWVRERHLDIAPVGDSGRRFLSLAQQELLKIRSYRAPRDKVICVLNCCKVIFGLLRNSKSSDTSADSFIPLLIYVVLQANPEHLVSNVQYILRFRNQDKLVGEAGYYISSLMGAIQFIESLDRTALTVSDDEFEENVEAAVSAIAERETLDQQELEKPDTEKLMEKASSSKDAIPRSSVEQMQRQQLDVSEASDPSRESEGKPGVPSLLRTIQRPLSNIGRIFSEELTPSQREGSGVSQQSTTAAGEISNRLSPAVFQTPRSSAESARGEGESGSGHTPSRMTAEEAALRQASAEAAQAQRIQRAEHQDVVETLAGMFPNLDRDVIDDVVRMKEGRVGSAVDACLALNT